MISKDLPATHRFRGKPRGSQRPIGSFPSAGITARGPNEGLFSSKRFFPSGVNGGGVRLKTRGFLPPYQIPERSCLSYVAGFGSAAAAAIASLVRPPPLLGE